ncbi:MAG: hypothetical protein KF813_14195, partial [Trueperaceae bacterium]|nr:hypothetical protein [Trueperaceae bacterium]
VDASPGSITLNSDTALYEVTITMHINRDALLDRFDEVALAERDKSRAEQDAAIKAKEEAAAAPATPSPSPSPSASSDGGK